MAVHRSSLFGQLPELTCMSRNEMYVIGHLCLPTLQSESKCYVLVTKISFHSYVKYNSLPSQNCALGLALKRRQEMAGWMQAQF